MFDDLFDFFDRDKKSGSFTRQSPRGLRGLLSRLAGEHEDDDRDRRSPRHAHEGNDRDRRNYRGRDDDDRDELLSDRSSRRHSRDSSDWLDD